MKRLCLLLGMFGLGVQVHSQPVFTNVSINNMGLTTAGASVLDTILMSQLNGGANQTWNLGFMTMDSSLSLNQHVDPATTPFAADFPTANYCISSIYPVDSSYSYSDLQSTYYDVLGTRYVSYGDTTYTTYTDPLRSFIFPLNYGDVHSDYYESYTTNSSTTYRTAFMTLTYSGYGTLNLPTGTYPNVIQLRRYFNIEDSSFVGSTSIVRTRTGVSVTFYDPASAGSLFSVTYDTLIVPLSPVFTSYYNSIKTIVAGISERADVKLKLSPNPSSGLVNITLPGSIKYERIIITDIYGRQVLNKTGDIENNHHVDISALSPGAYIFTLKNAHDKISVNFIRF